MEGKEKLQEEKYPASMDDLLKDTVAREGSDMHLTAGVPPKARVHGELVDLDYPMLTPDHLEDLIKQVVNSFELEKLNEDWELDFSYSLRGVARFRGNAMYQRNTLSVALRVVPYEVPQLEDLGLPKVMETLCTLARGLVLVTGPTGSGKSTTLAGMLDWINRHRKESIVTIEDPVEFLHRHKQSVIRQREVGIDTKSFPAALRHVLRQDPDIILIGEMRDLESIAIALSAAETGHLVFSTLHTQTAPLTISRIIDVFNEERRDQIRKQLANSLQAVVSQQILPTRDIMSRVVAAEVMISTPSVRNMIREGKEHQLYSVIQTSQAHNMQTMDHALGGLVRSGKISRETALEHCIELEEVERAMQSGGMSSGSWKF